MDKKQFKNKYENKNFKNLFKSYQFKENQTIFYYNIFTEEICEFKYSLNTSIQISKLFRIFPSKELAEQYKELFKDCSNLINNEMIKVFQNKISSFADIKNIGFGK